jgi:hypothetical protein
MTLLGVADSHPWGARTQELLAGPDPASVAMLPRSPSLAQDPQSNRTPQAHTRRDAPKVLHLIMHPTCTQTAVTLGQIFLPVLPRRVFLFEAGQTCLVLCGG